MVLTCFYATHADIRTSVGRKLSFRSALFSFLLQNAPLPLSKLTRSDLCQQQAAHFALIYAYQVRSFGGWLEPRYIFGATPLDQ